MTLVTTFFRSFFPIFQSHNKIIHIDVHSHGGLEKWSVIFFVWKNIIGFLFWKVVIYLSKRNEKICNGLISRVWAKHYFWYFIRIFALTYFQKGEFKNTIFHYNINTQNNYILNISTNLKRSMKSNKDLEKLLTV